MKTVLLDDEAYELLDAYRRADEDFSVAVRRLSRERSWREVVGIWADGTDDIEQVIEDRRSRPRRFEDFPDR